MFAGDGYIRPEFHMIAFAMIALCLHLHNIPIAFFLLSIVLILFGRIQQKDILRQNTWLSKYDPLDHHPIGTIEREETYNLLQFAMVAWLASLIVNAKVVQFIHTDINDNIVHSITKNFSLSKALVVNALVVVIASSTMEITYICSISGDWSVFFYMLLSMSVKILRTLAQGTTS